MIRDRFDVVLRHAKLYETLQMDADLTLASAVSKARLKETRATAAVAKQRRFIRYGNGDRRGRCREEERVFEASSKGASHVSCRGRTTSRQRSALSFLRASVAYYIAGVAG